MKETRSALRKLLPLAAAAAFLGGCGYALVGKGSALPPDIRSVSIPLFENRTGEPELDIVFTRVLRDEFIRDGRLKVAESSPDSTLRGAILAYTLRPLAYDERKVVTQYAVDLTVEVAHTAESDGRKLIRQRVQTTWQYDVDASVTESESQRAAASVEASRKAAETILSLVIESF